MNQNPYNILGVSPSATDDEVKKAYRKLAKQYHPDIHPDKELAAKKMAEINAAYDQILNQRQGKAEGYDSYEYSSSSGSSDPELQAVRNYLHYRRFQEAFNVLSRIQERNAEWYFLSAYAHAGVGNRAQALEFARKAVAMDPNNFEYRQFLQRLEYSGMVYTNFGRGFAVPRGLSVSPICLGLCLARMCFGC